MNKFVVVTGGSKGIGKALIEKFASQGFDVATCARRESELKVLQNEIEERFGVKAFIFQADLSDKNQIKAFITFVSALNRPVDVLINNAGYFIPGQVLDEPEGALESMINSNVFSAYYTTRGLAAAMKKIKSGHIFNMCSIASIKACPNGGSYAISKFALLGFSKVVREELKDFGIRVTAILPGATKTASWDGVNLPDDRFMKAADVADTVFAAYSLSKNSVVEEILIRPQLGDI